MRFLTKKQQGIVFVILAGFFFSLMSLCVRLAGDLPTMQKAFFRNAVASVVAFVVLLRTDEGLCIKKSSYKDLFFRSFCGTCGLILNFYAIDHLNIADANILNKLSPFFAVLMSVILLKERASKVDGIYILTAFIGALFVVKPSFDIRSVYGICGMLGGFFAGAAYTFVRKLGIHGERGPVIVLCFSGFSTMVTLPFMIVQFKPMSMKQLLLLLSAGIVAMIAQLCITTAYTKAPAKEISVYDYIQILFAALWGFLFLNQIPDWLSAVGYAIIIGSAMYKWFHGNKKQE